MPCEDHSYLLSFIMQILLVRVSHMKGLLDVPVCRVEDNTERRYLLSPPTGQDFSGYEYVPQGSTRYSANINKGIAAIGVGKELTFPLYYKLSWKRNGNSYTVTTNKLPSSQVVSSISELSELVVTNCRFIF